MLLIGIKSHSNYPTGTNYTNVNFIKNPSFEEYNNETFIDWTTNYSIQSVDRVKSGLYSLFTSDAPDSTSIAKQTLKLPIGGYKLKVNYYLDSGTFLIKAYGTASSYNTIIGKWQETEIDFISTGTGDIDILNVQNTIGYFDLISIYPIDTNEHYCYKLDGDIKHTIIRNNKYILTEALFSSNAYGKRMQDITLHTFNFKDLNFSDIQKLRFSIFSKNNSIYLEDSNKAEDSLEVVLEKDFQAKSSDNDLFDINLELLSGSFSYDYNNNLNKQLI